MKRIALMVLAGLPFVMQAAISVGTTVAPGAWCGDFAAAKAYVEGRSCPLVLIWGSTGCSHCAALSDALSTGSALSWIPSQSAVFCFVHDTATTDAANAKAFARGTGSEQLSDYPFVCFYWPSQDKTMRFSGLLGRMPSTSGANLFEQFRESYSQFVGSTSGSATDVEIHFPFGDTENDRLEVKAGQTSVTFPIKRTAVGAVPEWWIFNTDFYLWEIAWEGDDLMMFVTLTVPAQCRTAGKTFQIQILDSDLEVVEQRTVHVVGAVENSPKNPYWLGEKTADALAWGDWSMDIDAVTNKVRAFNAAQPAKKAYAMMLVEGSCWCPDCAMAEENFFAKQAFKDWATENQVVFGVLDIPNLKSGQAVPSLLRYETYETSDGFVSLRGTAPTNETARYQSGAGYLSRHNINYADALAVSERNAWLVGNHTTSNGWNNVMGALRTGVPVMLLLRDDGSVAGRWNYFSSVGPSAFREGYLRRLEELLAQVDDPHEESDDSVLTTTRELVSDGPVACSTVSTVDPADIYRLCGLAANDEAEVTVTGDAAALKVSLIDEAGAALATASGLASDGLTLQAKLTEGACFLKVEPQEVKDGTFFGYTNTASTVCAYSAALTEGSNGGVFGFSAARTNVMEKCGAVTLSVSRAGGSVGAASVTVALLDPAALPGGVTLSDVDLSWADGEEGVKTATVTVGDVAADVSLTFGLTDFSVNAKKYKTSTDRTTVRIYNADYAGDPVYRYVAVDKSLAVSGYQAGDTVRLTPLNGSLPTGVTLVSDGGTVRAAGCATEADGDCSVTFRVTLVRGDVEVGTQDVTWNFTVIDYDFAGDIPSLEICRNYRNLPVVENDEVKGLLQLTVPREGALSAKYMTAGRAFAYAADSWTGFDVLTGTLTAHLARVDDPAEVMTVVLVAEGGTVTFDDPVDGNVRTFPLAVNAFPGGATAWKGRYTVQMPQTGREDGWAGRLSGCACMALRMTDEEDVAQGAMLYAGVLPNGCGFSGSSVLMTNRQGVAQLPFYHVSAHRAAPFAFSGGLSIADRAAREAGLQWCVSNAWKTVWTAPDGPGHAGTFLAVGGLYEPERIRALFETDFAADLTDFAFTADVGGLTSGRYGSAAPMAAVPLTMSESGIPSVGTGVANAQGVTLEFLPDTGIVSGRFVLPFAGHSAAVSFRGVVLPGWQSCADCSEKVFVERPWACGACSFADRSGGRGIYRNGCAVGIGKYK